jgi:hypothetical protein
MKIIQMRRQGISLESDEKERLEWLGDDYDPEAFDLDEANERMATYSKLS